MALLADFVCETANSPGTATTVSLVGAAGGSYVTFASRYASGVSVYYTISDESSARETGIGTFTVGSPNTLARTTVLSNTLGTTARLNFLGSVLVYNSIPASKALFLDVSGNITGLSTLGISGTLTAGGVISTGTVDLNNNAAHRSKDTGGTYRNILFMDVSNWTTLVSGASGSGIRFLNSTQATIVFSVTNAGTTTIPVGQYVGCSTGNGRMSFTSNGVAINLSNNGNALYLFRDDTQLYAWGYGAATPMTLTGGTGGLAITGTLTQGSDRRIKSDIRTISGDDGAAWVMNSRPVDYLINGVWSAGFVAQEQIASGFQKGITLHENPAMIEDDESPEGQQFMVDAASRVAYLTAALQSAFARIEALEANQKGNP